MTDTVNLRYQKKVAYVIDGVGTSTAQNLLLRFADFMGSNEETYVGLDMDEHQAGRYMVDRFIQCPAAKSEEFIPFLKDLFEELLRSHERVVFIPIIDWGFEKIASEKWGRRVKVVLSPLDTIITCDDKLATYNLFVLDDEKPFRLPYLGRNHVLNGRSIVKPRRGGRGSIGLYKCENHEETEYAQKKLGKNHFTQHWIDGKEVTVDVLCDFHGDYVGSVCRDRLEVKAGVCHKAYVYEDDRYENIVQYICKKLKFIGPCNIQFIENESGIYLIEINPRFSGGLNLSIASGFDSPGMLLEFVYAWSKHHITKGKNWRWDAFQDPWSYEEGGMDILAVNPGYAYKYSEVTFADKHGGRLVRPGEPGSYNQQKEKQKKNKKKHGTIVHRGMWALAKALGER